MKKLIFILTVILFTTFYSCQKTENRTNNTVTYELDSIRIQIVNEITNDSTYAGTVILRQSAQDSFITFLPNNFPTRINGDSIITYSYLYNAFIQPEYNENAILINNKYHSNSWKSFGSHEDFIYSSIYKYDSNSKLDSVNTDYIHTKYTNFLEDPLNLTVKRKFQYNSNNLTQIVENFKKEYPSYASILGHDSIVYLSSNTLFNYTNNFSNPKNSIGIDLNDLIFNEFNSLNLVNYKDAYGEGSRIGSFPNPIFIIYNLLSYNINCTSLIESISYYPKIFDYDLGIYPTSNTLRATYTFDTANNNRVTKMAVENVNAQTQMVYTFYYKN